jgi:hypothetical protein
MPTSETAAEQGLKPAAQKKSLFKTPSWSKALASDSPVDLFCRADSRYTDIVQEQEQRRSKKKARLERERQRQVQGDVEGGGKRRRISEEDDVSRLNPLQRSTSLEEVEHGRSGEKYETTSSSIAVQLLTTLCIGRVPKRFQKN